MVKSTYEKMKDKYGFVGSWAIWNEKDVTDIDIIHKKVSDLKPNIILVGLNVSKEIETPFSNFHRTKNDYKLGFSILNTMCYGAYMTDIIKDCVDGNSREIIKSLTPDIDAKYIEAFKKELSCLGSESKIIIAMHGEAYKILNRHLRNEYKINRITHYSYRFKGCHIPRIYAMRVHKELREFTT